MTTSCVLDVSAVAAVLFREPDGAVVAPLLFAIEQAFVPAIFHLELANVARTKVRRRELDWAAAEQLLCETSVWPVEVRPVAWQDAWPMAREHDLTTYDAAYLVLAIELSVPPLTLDGKLAAAAGDRSLLPAG